MEVSQVPAYIEKSVTQLQTLSRRIEESASAGRDAAIAAKEAQGKRATFRWYESAEKERKAIAALQKSGVAQAKAIETFSDAQKLTFDYLSDVTKILRGLFVLGCASLAKNRMVVEELEARLRGAGEEQLNELARQELESLLMDLNEQRDVMERQEKLGANQREQAGLIEQNTKEIRENCENDAKQDVELSRQREKDDEHDRLVKSLSERMARIERSLVPMWVKIAIAFSVIASSVSLAIAIAK
jgi:hypothetical protein